MNSAPPPPELIAPLLVSLILGILGGGAFGKAMAEWRQGRPSEAGALSNLLGAMSVGWSVIGAARLPREYWRYPAAVAGIWILAWLIQRIPRKARKTRKH